jgi:hypothetical protein
MSYTTWSTDASLNVSVNGVNISEGCPPGNLNNMGREIMAGVASLRDAMPSITGLAPLTGAVFTGTQPRYTGAGAYLFNASSGNTSGRVSFLAEGSALPTSPANGDIVLFFTP